MHPNVPQGVVEAQLVLDRSDLVDKGWNATKQLSDEEIEKELLGPLIQKLNEYREIDTTWECCGDTLVAAQRQRLSDVTELPTFFICTIRKRFEAAEPKPVPKKEDFLTAIAPILAKHSSLRFGELISNAMQRTMGGATADLLTVSDEDLVRILRAFDG